MTAPLSATSPAPITTALGADGVLLATIDMAGRTMNVFSAELMDALDALMDRVERDPAVKSCVITSGKASFLAGADLVMVRGYCDAAKTDSHEQMFEMCGRLGRQFVRLEASAKPWVAAVNGLALGGGLELALACRMRIVSDDPRIQLGLPEVRWGLLPGAGGTQRLPRLAGFEPALGLLLSGRSIDPAAAVKLGLFASTSPATRLLDDARAIAVALHGKPYQAGEKFPLLAQADVPPANDDTARAVALRHGVSAEDYDLYPAYRAIADSVLQGARLPLAEATAVEMNNFLRLMFSPVAGCMVRTLFLERVRAEREAAPPAGVAVESLRVGAVNATWAAALAKLKLPQQADAALPADGIELTDRAGQVHRATLRSLDDASATQGPQLVLSPIGPYGRVLEVAGATDASAAVFSAFASKLWALPWRTPGPTSRLAELQGHDLPAQARIAAGWPDRGDPAFTDVAACLAGLAPAWSGGPLTWAAEQAAR